MTKWGRTEDFFEGDPCEEGRTAVSGNLKIFSEAEKFNCLEDSKAK